MCAYAQAGDSRKRVRESTHSVLDELVAGQHRQECIAFSQKPVLGNDRVAVENRRLIAAAIKAGFHGQSLGGQPRARGHG